MSELYTVRNGNNSTMLNLQLSFKFFDKVLTRQFTPMKLEINPDVLYFYSSSMVRYQYI